MRCKYLKAVAEILFDLLEVEISRYANDNNELIE